jgi:tetratricopeptide (TPR) repeat protein
MAFIEGELGQACGTFSDLLAAEPANPDFRLALAQVERHRFVYFMLAGRPEDATNSFRAATALLDGLVAEFPLAPRYSLELADTLSLASASGTSLSPGEAEDCLQRAIEYCRKLVAALPAVPEYRLLLATCYRNLARMQRSRGQFADADENFTLARESLQPLLARHQQNSFYPLNDLVTTIDHVELKRVWAEAGNDPGQLRKARAMLEAALARWADGPRAAAHPLEPWVIVLMYDVLATTLRDLGEDSAAADAASYGRRLRAELFPPALERIRPPDTRPRDR